MVRGNVVTSRLAPKRRVGFYQVLGGKVSLSPGRDYGLTAGCRRRMLAIEMDGAMVL
jgi:hypothetical protein